MTAMKKSTETEPNPVQPLTTAQVSVLLGVRLGSLHAAIVSGRVAAPIKDASGRYLWYPKNVAAAREGMAQPRRESITKKQTKRQQAQS